MRSKIVERIIFKTNRPLLPALGFNGHLGAQPVAEVFLEFGDVGIFGFCDGFYFLGRAPSGPGAIFPRPGP